ncbi:MAG: acetate/propionate family kinase [Myxococcota bacterium]
MDILVINCGSSSIKAAVVDSKTGVVAGEAAVQRLQDGDGECQYSLNDGPQETLGVDTHEDALDAVLPQLVDSLPDGTEVVGVGHRVVHGGKQFDRTVLIDDEVEATIEELIPIAPLHNPNNLAGIRAARRVFADLPHFAVFDTAFHRTMPTRAKTYAISQEVAGQYDIERFGFHGVSHGFVSRRAAEFLGEDVRDLRIITCHLGNGCSLAAVEYGRSIETSMGLTPLEGVAMGTRSGDLDPGAIIHLLRQDGWDVDKVDDLLNRNSGLKGLSGVSNDLRDIESRAADGDDRCRLAIQVFAHRVRKYIGAYAAVMGGVDAIVFTAGIGQNSALMRHRIAQRLDFLGARIDEDANREVALDDDTPVADFSMSHSRCRLLAVATDEQHGIAQECARVLADQHKTKTPKTIPIAVSARHVHLTQDTVEALFGEGHTLTERNPLSQPGQFASEETVTLVGPKRKLEGVRVLGPTRGHNQVEISRTDEFHLGIDAPVRASGDIDNTPGIKLVGPEGEVSLEKGLICALRHIHMTPEDAEDFDVTHGDIVEVAVRGGERDLVFGDTMIRVKDSYKLEMHIDTDEGNAANLSSGAAGALVSTGATAEIQSRRARYDEAAE